MLDINKKIGVWGFGIVGKSVINYLAPRGYQIQVTDKREATEQEQLLLQQYNIPFVPYKDLDLFLDQNDTIIASPGIDLRNYAKYESKFVSELDLFYQAWKKPIIAVTGTVGKTSIVHLLSIILKHAGKKIITGGNIGTGMLDLVKDQDTNEASLLELSSFQLDQTKIFAADLAVLTNFYPNHLDRHGSLENYFDAKCKILTRQTGSQHALVPWELRDKIAPRQNISFFSQQPIEQSEIVPGITVFAINNNTVQKYTATQLSTIIDLKSVANISYLQNWLILIAVCDILNVNTNILRSLPPLDLPPDRLEYIASINGTLFYNDSKSTLPESTLAAINQFNQHPIHLFLGGISKGIDRTELIKNLSGKVRTVFCFGAEADTLYKKCLDAGIKSYNHKTLEESFMTCISVIKNGELVLFSPAGASFDLFKNYHERGEYFKSLVSKFQQKI